MNLTTDDLKKIIDTVFGVIETAEAGHPLALTITKAVQAVADAEIGTIAAALGITK